MHIGAKAFAVEPQRQRFGSSFVASFLLHVAMIGLASLAMRSGAQISHSPVRAPSQAAPAIIWLAEAGPGGGGGGGGNRMKDPPRHAELPGRDRLTVPIKKLSKPEPLRHVEPPNPIEPLILPAVPLAAGTVPLPGVIEAPMGLATESQGQGSDGGAGTGDKGGIGPGSGPGLGPGERGGSGGRVYQVGSGVTAPIPVFKGRPQYTVDAMRARLSGSVLLECVVRPDGTCTDIRVVRSLDPALGLDQEAIVAARQWRFRPGTRGGEPVPVRVTLELSFAIR